MVVFFVSYVPILVSYLDLDPSAGSAGVFQEVSLEIQHKGRGCVASVMSRVIWWIKKDQG